VADGFDRSGCGRRFCGIVFVGSGIG
jgi:hypothetical protein